VVPGKIVYSCQEARKVKIILPSDSSLLVVFGNAISPALHQRVMALFQALQGWHDPRIRNLHPGYASLLIDFDPLRLTHDELSSVVQRLALAGAGKRLRRRHARQRGHHSGVL
jgi:inhibitor of KinA